MVDSVHSGYKEAAQTVAWTTGQSVSTIANDEWTDESDEIDNSTVKYLFADFFLSATLGTAQATEGETVSLYLLPSVDDTNYPTWENGNTATDADINQQYYVGSFTLTDIATEQKIMLRGIALPAGKFKLGLRNNCATGDLSAGTLKYRRWNYASA